MSAAIIACASLGATWSTCAAEFGPRSVIDRFGQVEPTVLLVVPGYGYRDRYIDRSEQIAAIRAGLPTLKHVVGVPYGLGELRRLGLSPVLLWVLVAAERFGTVEASLGPALEQVHRSGTARGLVAAYSTLGLLKLRLGALPEADAAARVALYVLQEGDFAPGLGFAATVLADVAVEAGQLDEAQALLDLLPRQGWPAGVGTVLIPAARGRLRLAQGRAAEAVAQFRACGDLFGGISVLCSWPRNRVSNSDILWHIC